MPSDLHTPNGLVLASQVRLESWRICSWFELPEGEERVEFTDLYALDAWLRQFDPAGLRELAYRLGDDLSLSPRDDDAIVAQLAGLIRLGSLVVHGPYFDPYRDELPARPDAPFKPEPKPKPKPDRPRPPRVPDNSVKPRIIAVEFLDGSADKVLASGPQYVNLPADQKWVDGARITSKDRLSHKPRVRVWFDRPGSHGFKVRYLPGEGNAAYTGNEKGRNPRFKFQTAEKSYATAGDGTLILPVDDFFVTAAGRDSYLLEATDEQGNKVRSGKIETRRLVHYLPIKMRTLASIAPSLAPFRDEYAKHCIDMVELPAVQIDHMPNIGLNDAATLQANARTAYEGSQAPGREPFVLAVVFTDHLAVKRADQRLIQPAVTVGPGRPNVVVPIVGPGLTNPAVKTRPLWRNLVPGEGWFVSCSFLPTGATPVTGEITIAEANCQPIAASAANTDDCRSVSIDVSSLPAGSGTLTLRVNWIDRMRAGLAFGSGNAICICTRAWWRTSSASEQNDVLVHEAGHHVGMVADGTAKLPDAVPTLYNSTKGHVGNHCHHGIPAGQARYDSSADGVLSDCVMYGSTNGFSAFCADCAPSVRKVDLSTGWTRF